MIRLHAIQARFGDCFLLEYGETSPAYILIDGGPTRNYDEHLKPALDELMKNNQRLEAVIVSHVDNDHIMGVLDLLVDLKYQHDTGTRPFLDVGQLWFNSFKSTIDSNDFENRVRAINTIAGVNGIRMQEMSMAVNSIKEGYQLLTVARALNIPINTNTQQGFYLANRNRQTIKIANLEIAVIGPTIKNLEMLRKEWESWIALNEQKIREGKYTKDFAAMADKSIPNLSSMVLLVNADGKSLLFTGDCRGDHLQQGLTETGLSVDGRFHVDIFKVPHHGSRRNTSKRFFEEVTADTYVISADGTYDNPDEETLDWIVESAHEAGRKIKLFLTNKTPSTAALQQKYEPGGYGYEIQFMGNGKNSLLIT